VDARAHGKRGIVPYFPYSPSRRGLPARSLPLALFAILSVVLGGCASMTDIPAGTPLDQVVAQFGQPTTRCPREDGGETLVWSTQPYGQYAWRTQTDRAGRVGPVRAAFTDANFETLRTGVWTQRDVYCAFGPPARRDSVGLPSVRQIVWSYRYRQSGVWNSLMYVYFGHDGERVTHLHPGPDPLFEPQWWILGQ